jgi:hypothetical protein
MDVLETSRNVMGLTVITGMATSTKSMSAEPATNLMIEHLDEFAVGNLSVALCLCSRADYVSSHAPTAA